ncbi:MAG: lipopolysaccharide heptosyltransferase II [Actinomycetota bacterium]|nr:lipopolysaccharide heptosyltransferase II [Actinomycetota bacterium]
MDKLSFKKGLKKVLVIKPSSLGDVVHSLPFLFSLKKGFPDAEVHWVIADSFAPLLSSHPLIHKLWVIKKDGWIKPGSFVNTIGELARLGRDLKRESFDAVFDLQGLLRSALIAKATGAAIRVGFEDAREGGRLFYTHLVGGRRERDHAVKRYLNMAKFAGCQTEAEFPMPASGEFTPPFDQYAVIVPGARWNSKRWPIWNFAEVAAALDMNSVVIGAASDRVLADEVVSHSGGKSVSLAGETDLRQLVEVMRRARFVLTNDSGPMHIAAALGVPVFALFGPTDPAVVGPYDNGRAENFVFKRHFACSPCRKRVCPGMRCMSAIEPGWVIEKIRKKFF